MPKAIVKYTTLLIRGADAELDAWIERLLDLDRETMGPILRAAGRPFPQENRRKSLSDCSTIVILVLRGEAIAGYAEFTQDWTDPDALHVASLQLRSSDRRGRAFGILLAACIRALRPLEFSGLSAGVHQSNGLALALYRKLGFKQRGVTDHSVALYADRELLGTPRAERLARAFPCPPSAG